MAHAYRTDALRYLADRPLTPFSSLVLRAVVVLMQWAERRRTRCHLSQLDQRMLQDIGVTEHQAYSEAKKPFWIP